MEFRVYLRALEPDDYKTTIEWRKEDEVWNNLIGPRRYVSSDTEKRWVERSILEHEKGERFRFIVCKKETNEVIGLFSVSNIDLLNKKCEPSSIISPGERGKGYVFEARLLVFHYLYSQLGIERIEARIMETNNSMLKAGKKFGYYFEGKQRMAVYKNGEQKDLLLFSMLKSEFYDKYGELFK